MRNQMMCLIAGLLLVLSPWPALAQDSGDPYVAESPIKDESSETRNKALSGLLASVLVRVSGNTGIAGQPPARELLDSAPSLVQQYRYRTEDQDGKLVRYLWARFDQSAVERMMRERNLPIWVQRPRVLLWVATQKAGERELLNLENQPQARAKALARARQRGMPLQLPLMDLEDQSKLAPADLWSDYQPGIQSASARYPHELILVGRLTAQRGGKWGGAWTVLGENVRQVFQTPPQGLGDALAFGIDQTQNFLAARYAPMPGVGGSSGTLVSFSDIYDLPAYGRLMAIIDRLQPATQVALRHVEQDRFLFEFRLRGGEQDLLRALQGSGQLVAEPGPMRYTPMVSSGSGSAAEQLQVAPPQADYHFRLVN